MPQRPPPCPARDGAALGPSFWEGGSKLWEGGSKLLSWGAAGAPRSFHGGTGGSLRPVRAGPVCSTLDPALRFSSTKLNYNGRDYSDISPALSKRLGVKGSVLERVRGAAIHTRELTVL